MTGVRPSLSSLATFKTEVSLCVETLCLLFQTPRSRASAVEFIVRMSDFETVRRLRLVSNRLLSPIKKDTSHWQALSRVEMVKQLLLKHGMMTVSALGELRWPVVLPVRLLPTQLSTTFG